MKTSYILPLSTLFFFILALGCKKELLDLKNETNHIDLQRSNLPNFSFVGYKRCESPLPILTDLYSLRITADSNRNHTKLIQSKIDELSNRPLYNGFRGVLILEAGTYYLTEPININVSGIVIKGERDPKGMSPTIH